MPGKLSKNIFVIDDEEMYSTALEEYITRKSRHTVKLFKTGEECLDELYKTIPDVIILDYNLSTVVKDAANGMAILEAIKKIDNNIRVIMLSSQESYATAMNTIKVGAEDYIIKDENSFDRVLVMCNE